MGVILERTRSGARWREGDVVLAEYVAYPSSPAAESPRPYLHPVRSRRGELVTGMRPADHRWHHGISLALPYVGAANLWGGRTWVRERGAYLDLGNNGSMRTVSLEVDGAALRSELTWLGPDGAVLARERRELRAELTATGWAVSWSTRVRAVAEPLRLGSPATHGRDGAGYGGIFMRAAEAFRDGTITTDDGRAGAGEDLLGTRARALTLRAPDAASITMSVADPAPWFARTREYPGFGPAPFFSEEGVLRPDADLVLACRIAFDSSAEAPPSHTGPR